MVVPLGNDAAAAATATTTTTTTTSDICLTEDLLFLDFPCGSASQPSTGAGALRQQGHFIQDLLESTMDGFPDLGPIGDGGGGVGEQEEEELEWLSNKDAFPSLEMDFDISSPSLSSGGLGGEIRSPVSVLTATPPLCVPVRPRSKGRRRPRYEMARLSAETAKEAALRAVAVAERRCCRHCQSEVTPQWRAGPDGPKTLCNACGVRYKSGRLLPEYRPASSPTFSAAQHSNSHRRVLEMRKRKATGDRPSWLAVV